MSKEPSKSTHTLLLRSFKCPHQFSSVQLLSHVLLFATSWTVAHQAPVSMEFSRPEYWSGLLFPSPVDLPDPGIKPRVSNIVGRLFTISATRKATSNLVCYMVSDFPLLLSEEYYTTAFMASETLVTLQ